MLNWLRRIFKVERGPKRGQNTHPTAKARRVDNLTRGGGYMAQGNYGDQRLISERLPKITSTPPKPPPAANKCNCDCAFNQDLGPAPTKKNYKD